MPMFPDRVYDIITSAVKKHPKAEDAIKAALASVRAMPEFSTIVDELVLTAVSELVWRERSKVNDRLRNQAGTYGQPAKVVVGNSVAVNSDYESYFLYKIGGNVLGELTGDELGPLAQLERLQADGHMFNSNLLEALSKDVRGGKKVKEVVGERKLRNLFERLKKKSNEAA